MLDKIINIRNLKIDDGISNTEATLYRGIINDRDVIIKVFYDLCSYTKEYNDKKYVIDKLFEYSDVIDINELILPLFGLSMYDSSMSVIYPYVDGINFNSVINDKGVSVDEKVLYLKEIGKILEDMKCFREREDLIFYLGDIHEDNFVINKKSNRVNVVDMDSCKICDSVSGMSKYLYLSNNIGNFSKYGVLESKYVPIYDINYNTDLFCYIMIILNYIFNLDMVRVSCDNFNLCMEYLRSIGFSYEFITILARIYSNYDNVNPYMLLDEISFYKDSVDRNKDKLVRRLGL